MKLTVIAALIIVILAADICLAIDPDLNARLGIPVQPQSSGETFDQGLINGGLSAGLGGCGDLGVTNQLSDLLSMAQQAAGNAKSWPGLASTALIAYFFPTEYSVSSNLLSEAHKYLAVLSDKCKTYQTARDYMENKDIAGIRKASFAKCMEQNNGDDVFCSKPSNAWYSLFGTQECVSAVDTSLKGVTLPDGTGKDSIKAFFGDVKMCPNGSGGTPPTMTADKVYQANMLFYGPEVDSAVYAARTRYITQDDIKNMKLCVGAGNNNSGGNGGVICPHAETINMIASFPADEQTVFKIKLAERLSLLQTVYSTYSWSSIMNKAASNAQMPVPDAFTTPIAQMTGQKEKEVNDLVKLKNQANGNDGDLSNWERQVMERNSYWQQRQQNVVKAKVQHEAAYGSKGNDATNKVMQQDILQDIKNSYNK